jgi:hypothetical protein
MVDSGTSENVSADADLGTNVAIRLTRPAFPKRMRAF